MSQRQQRIQILHICRQTLSFIRDAAIARSTINLRCARRLPQFPYQRVLPSPASNDKNFHSFG